MKPTTVEEYNKKFTETYDVTLPSGAIFRLRKYIPARKLALKYLPLINDISRNAKEKNEAKMAKMKPEQIEQAVEMNDYMLTLLVVEPKLSVVPEPDKICIDDIPNEDYQYLINVTANSSRGDDIALPLSGQDKQPPSTISPVDTAVCPQTY